MRLGIKANDISAAVLYVDGKGSRKIATGIAGIDRLFSFLADGKGKGSLFGFQFDGDNERFALFHLDFIFPFSVEIAVIIICAAIRSRKKITKGAIIDCIMLDTWAIC